MIAARILAVSAVFSSGVNELQAHWAAHLDDLAAQGLRRRLRALEAVQWPYVTLEDRRLLCFCSNNYLGLADHLRVRAAVKEAVDRWGWGAGASRLVCGTMGPHAELESRLAAFKGTEAALVFPTGYAANLAAVRSLAGRGDLVLLDKLNHASIVDAARGSGAEVRVFQHRDYDRLEILLRRYRAARRRVIVTDSVFSMDGDFADLPRLVELKRRHAAALCIDEAHACGIFGRRGSGMAELMGVEAEIDVVVGTLSKAFGGLGGFVAGSRSLVEYLVNTAGTFIYTTGLPPAACAGALAALDIIESAEGEERRARLLAYAAAVGEALQPGRKGEASSSPPNPGAAPTVSRQSPLFKEAKPRAGFSPIIPYVVGDAAAAVQLASKLESEGLLIPAIRPPTVPRDTARLRISLSAGHSPEQIQLLLAAIARLKVGHKL